EGRELRDIMNDQRLLPVDQVLDIAAQVAQGLAYAHEHDIVHRDVKPSNVMVVRDGHVKITDFGIARMASSAVQTQTGMVLGSPKYMSPEQVMGKAIDHCSDIFSLGVMLYEMLTGQSPFNGDNVNAIMYQTLNAVPAPPNTLNPEVPEMMNFIVAKSLAKKLEDRYQSAQDFAVDLRACREVFSHVEKKDKSRVSGREEIKFSHAVDMARAAGSSEEEALSSSLTGLSQAFDSSAATLRLASLTATSDVVDELSKTLRISRPSMEEIFNSAPKHPIDSTSPSHVRVEMPAPSGGGKFFLLFVLVMLLLVMALIFASANFF
ncbi:MAG: serine/threonine-protein kinase, partial [Gallionella sp.]